MNITFVGDVPPSDQMTLNTFAKRESVLDHLTPVTVLKLHNGHCYNYKVIKENTYEFERITGDPI